MPQHKSSFSRRQMSQCESSTSPTLSSTSLNTCPHCSNYMIMLAKLKEIKREVGLKNQHIKELEEFIANISKMAFIQDKSQGDVNSYQSSYSTQTLRQTLYEVNEEDKENSSTNYDLNNQHIKMFSEYAQSQPVQMQNATMIMQSRTQSSTASNYCTMSEPKSESQVPEIDNLFAIKALFRQKGWEQSTQQQQIAH